MTFFFLAAFPGSAVGSGTDFSLSDVFNVFFGPGAACSSGASGPFGANNGDRKLTSKYVDPLDSRFGDAIDPFLDAAACCIKGIVDRFITGDIFRLGNVLSKYWLTC